MQCYKCSSQENLSIKSQRKETGYKLMICKACRLDYHYKREVIRIPPEDTSYMNQWRKRAYDNVERLSRKYA